MVMKLEEVRGIKMSTSEAEINLLLAKGYQILKILSTKAVSGDREVVVPTFILGVGKSGD